MNTLGDFPQTVRAVINGVHRRDDGEKDLGRANVTGRFVASDVLLACLQSEPKSGPAFGIVRNANETTSHVPLELIARGEIGGVRSAETEWNTKSLGVADCNIRSEFTRRF